MYGGLPEDWGEVIRPLELGSSSPGPGYRDEYGSKLQLFPHAFIGGRVGQCPEAIIKEEAAKVEKIKRGEYRFIFNYPMVEFLLMRFFSHVLNKTLKQSAFVYMGENLLNTMPQVANHLATLANDGWDCFCIDSSTHDRHVNPALMVDVLRVRQLLGDVFLPTVLDLHLKPRFITHDSLGRVHKVECVGAVQLSGIGDTTTNNTISMLIGIFRLVYKLQRNFFVKGAGDNFDFGVQTGGLLTSKDIVEHFAQHGLVMKPIRINKVTDFDSMGASMVITPKGVQPHWNLYKSIVHLAYQPKKQTTEQYWMRAAQICHSNYYHPEFHKFFLWFFDGVMTAPISPRDKVLIIQTSMCMTSEYVTPESALLEHTAVAWWRDFKMNQQFESSEAAVANKMNRLNGAFSNLMSRSGCSQDGIAYAKMTLDPFHDSTLTVVGAPDSYTGRSLVYDVRKQVVIDKPASIGAQNWDCHIAAVPFLHQYGSGGTQHYSVETSTTTFYCNVTDANGAPTGTTVAFPANSPVVYSCAPSGVSTFTAEYSQTDSALLGLDLLSGISLAATDKFRVIGLAFEVNNTTAEINKQGAVTCYRTLSSSNYGNMRGFTKFVTAGTTSAVRQYALRTFQFPPGTVSEAQQMDGVVWKAADGALVPVVIDFENNAPCTYNCENVLYQTGQNWSITYGTPAAASGKVSFLPTTMVGTSFINSTAMTQTPAGSLSLELPMMQSGAYFTGLSPETSLTLSVRAFIEVFPAPYSVNYALARPAPPLDPQLAGLLSSIQGQLQPGYPAGMNAKADFFKSVVGLLGSAYKAGATPLKLALSAAPDPRLKAIASGIEAAEVAVAAGKALAKATKKKGKPPQKKQPAKKK